MGLWDEGGGGPAARVGLQHSIDSSFHTPTLNIEIHSSKDARAPRHAADTCGRTPVGGGRSEAETRETERVSVVRVGPLGNEVTRFCLVTRAGTRRATPIINCTVCGPAAPPGQPFLKYAAPFTF